MVLATPVRRLAAALLLTASPVWADDTQPPANAMLKGPRYTIKPGLAYQTPQMSKMPYVSQDVSFAISNHLGWAFPIGPIVLSPGASVPVYFFDSGDARYTMGGRLPGGTLGVLGELEVHLPLRYLSIYGTVGAGAAFAFASNQQGGIFRGGGGVMVYPVPWLGLGMQAAYVGFSHAALGMADSIDALEMVWPIELRL